LRQVQTKYTNDKVRKYKPIIVKKYYLIAKRGESRQVQTKYTNGKVRKYQPSIVKSII